MTDKEKAIRCLENIAYECDKLTSGNVAHLKAQIKGMAIRFAKYLKKQEPTSEDLDNAASSFAREDSKGIKNPANFYYIVAEKARIFKTGAQWHKEQMMKLNTLLSH